MYIVVFLSLGTDLVCLCSMEFVLVWFASVPGFGTGLVCMCTDVSIQQHFTRNRPFATAISSSGSSLSAMVWPPLTGWLADWQGWRLTITALAMGLMQTVPLSLLIGPLQNSGEQDHSRDQNDPGGNSGDQDQPADHSSERNHSGHMEHPVDCSEKPERSLGASLARVLGLTLLTNPAFLLYCTTLISLSLACSCFTMHIINKAIFSGIDRTRAALLQSTRGLMGLVSRVAFGLLTTRVCLNKLHWTAGGSVCIGAAIALSCMFDHYAVLVLANTLYAVNIGKWF